MKFYRIFLITFLSFISCYCSDPKSSLTPISSSKILIENFEGTTYKRWIVEGNAFSINLVDSSLLREWGDVGFEGTHIITSYINGDGGVGTITSPTFNIEKKHIVFLISGGGDFNKCYSALFVNGVEVKREAGSNSRIMKQVSWDVSDYIGKNAYIKLVDNSTAAWGFINADYFYQTDDSVKITSSRKILVEKKYLNFPIATNAKIGNLMIMENGKIVYDIDMRLADNNPNYWVHMNCTEWIGQEIEIFVPVNQFLNGYSTGKGLELIYQSDKPGEESTFYTELLRPQIHYTASRGWLNDPNGLFWKDGLWHLYYQHNPFGTDWGNMHWGHAVSTDLVHWTEQDEALKPDSLGVMFSGQIIIDENNTLGFQKNNIKTVVAYYTAAGEYNYISRNRPFTQCMAYSTDNGFSWNKYKNNPILDEITFQNRDPHVVWNPESNCWNMVLYMQNNQYGFFSSTDLISWKQTSTFDISGEIECPDFFRMKVENSNDDYKWVIMGVHNNYYVGDFNGGVFYPSTILHKQDLGINGWYAAAHTFTNAPNNRRVQIGCMAGSDFVNLPFNQIMAFPKELKLYKTTDGDYKIHAQPVEEIESLYDNIISYKDVSLSNETISNSGKAFYIKGIFDIAKTNASYFGFEINGVKILYYPDSKSFIAVGTGLQTLTIENVSPINDVISFEILLDTGIIEFFVNNGEYSASQCFLTSNTDKTISFIKDANSIVKVKDMRIGKLKSMWK